MNHVYVRKHDLKVRYENFGGICWFPFGELYQLNSDLIAFLDLLEIPRRIDNKNGKNFFFNDIEEIINQLLDFNLIEKTIQPSFPISNSEIKDVKQKINDSKLWNINKPFWAHIQPFNYCNQNCIHCYCNANKILPRFNLELKVWERIIDKLENIGIIDIYISGGENLIIKESFKLAKYIINKGMGTGISTNAQVITKNSLKELSRLKFQRIQVSLDSADSKNYDYIRGTKNGLLKAINGIKKLSLISDVIVNTVVTKLNINELESIIKLGASLGIKEYKFFPVKACGRADKNRDKLLLNDVEIQEVFHLSSHLQEKNNVVIECPNIGEPCGSGFSGFAVNEYGDIFPCIFAVENNKYRIGNIMTDDILDLWFHSRILQKFRKKNNLHPCKRCE